MSSGWCPPYPHPNGHQACQERQDAGLLDPCDCTAYGGHARVAGTPPVAPEKPPKTEVAA